jgi:hypothetical protein
MAIRSSADIISRLRNDPVVNNIAKVAVTSVNKPSFRDQDGVVIYVSQYPTDVTDFTARWGIWIIDYGDEPLDVLIRQLRKLLPDFTVLEEGPVTSAVTTELLTEKTEIKPRIEKKESVFDLEQQFKKLKEDLQDRMLLIGPGRPGRDGKDGKDGKDGQDGVDGKDLLATDAELGDLRDVDIEANLNLEKGQVLTWDGSSWTNLYVPRTLANSGYNPAVNAVHVTDSTYNITVTDYYVGIDYSGPVTITLPVGSSVARRLFVIKDESGEAGNGTNRYITILPQSPDLIDGDDHVLLAYNYGSLTLIWTGGAWRVI